MACPNCSAETTAGQKFCFECGTELAVACSNCGASLPTEAKFCGECGTPAGQAEAPEVAATTSDTAEPTAERRLVSVLFADLVGFTATSEHRDPEEVREFLTRYSELATDTIERYGGTVDKFIGDGVMAIWGTPTAFEDDAERAVRTALDLATDVETLGAEFGVPGLSVRAGIATGEAAVTLDAGSHGMVAGDLVNTASRLEASAEPGTVLVNGPTQLATYEAISYEPAGELTLKGKTKPLSVWRPLHVVAMRGGAGRVSGLEAPFVGRVAELQMLKDLFLATGRDGRAHLVSVQGIPGIGKSRLVWEFEKYLDGLADLFYWHQGRSPAYGEGITFWALGEMVRRRAGIAETDDHFFTTLQLDAIVDEFVPEEDRRWISTALQVLLGVSDSPGIERDELFAAWRAFFQHLSTQAPAVMVFEDLQWADHGTLDFIESMLEWSRGYPIFIVTLARPELLDRRENWGAGQRGFTTLHLEALSPAEIEELLEGLAPGLAVELKHQIRDRSEGVPLYAVETVRMLIGQGHLVEEAEKYRLAGGIPELAIPETLHALVAARLDTLDPDDRQLLQKASVLGQSFTIKALADLAALSPGDVEQRLEPLVRREILSIEADPRSPERGQYQFVQSVIREVAYSSLGRTERSALHIQVAELLEELGDDELAGAIASHYVDAYEALPAGPDAERVADRARTGLRTAAQRAEALGSHDQAVAYWEQAMGIETASDELAALWEDAAGSAIKGGRFDVAEPYLRQAVDWHQQQNDQITTGRATARLGEVMLMQSRVEPAIEMMSAALEELAGRELDPEVIYLHAQLARAYAFHIDPEESLEHSEAALAAASKLDLVPQIADALITKAWALSLTGRTREYLAMTEGAMLLAERNGDVASELRARNNIAAWAGFPEPLYSLEVSQRGLEIAQKLGHVEMAAQMGTKAAWLLHVTGQWDEALRVLDDIDREVLPWFERMQIISTKAPIMAFRGDIEGAQALIGENRAHWEGSTSVQDHVELWRLESLIALAENRPNDALANARRIWEGSVFQYTGLEPGIDSAIWLGDAGVLDEIAAAAERYPETSARVEASVLLADAARHAWAGDKEQAGNEFSRVMEIRDELGLAPGVAMAGLAAVMTMGPDNEVAKSGAARAREIFTDLGAKPFLERLDEATKG